ncbi:uncharacterized protein Triagg1_5446 [Trichoderma aggressivum f. europaeum]|uniref:Uncharacterized protein n=1 Tax=Trichoderma aggressivum f. europaeum TaxID=173218 RepID=A0AAE1LZD5_9HYPO|nr:hypothetical protein Triagg1_5446 [Trichoderma aggressivum f. europaeum]
MKVSLVLGAIALLPTVISAKASPPAAIAEYCRQKGQFAQLVKGVWKCVQISDVCSPGEDAGTIHQDKDTGEWVCCLKGHELKDGRCAPPASECPLPTGFCKSPTCAKTLRSAELETLLRQAFLECFPHDEIHLDSFIRYQINSLETGINLFEKIYQDKQQPLDGRQSPSNPSREWWNCAQDNSPCKWLALEHNNAPKKLAPSGYEKMILPNPNQPISNYIYPFDMWMTKLAGGQFTLYINGNQIQPHDSGLDFFIPAGTAADDVWYKSETGALILFYGSCSADTPCLGRQVVPWTRGVSHKRLGQDGEIYIGQYDDDLVLTIADTETTSEQYTVFADGVKLGSTHGRLTLGDEKYKRSNIRMVDVGSGAAGALRSIANDGFWGSFKIPRGARKITIVDDSSDFDFAFEYRLDTACSC